jgi:hypothetical protein
MKKLTLIIMMALIIAGSYVVIDGIIKINDQITISHEKLGEKYEIYRR